MCSPVQSRASSPEVWTAGGPRELRCLPIRLPENGYGEGAAPSWPKSYPPSWGGLRMSASRQGGSETSGSGDHFYHYNRDERLAGQPVRDQPSGSIFRRNRSLLIIMLDIVIVLLMFVLYLFFFRDDPDTVQLAGYRIEGNAFLFDESLYVTVRVDRSTDSDAPAGQRPAEQRPAEQPPAGARTLLTVRFPDQTEVTDALPVRAGYPTTVRHVLDAEQADRYEPGDTVAVDVDAGGQTTTVEIPVRE